MRIWLTTLLLMSWSVVGFGQTFVQTPIDDQIQISRLDWPWWRGPFRNGISVADQTPPTTWSEQENVIWKSPVPGRGHGSPIVVGDGVYLAIADRERGLQSVICYDRASGEQVWESVLHRGGLMQKNEKASQASSTLAWDGERLFANFLNDGAVYTTALRDDGERLWQRKISDYIIHQGYASSPAIYQDLVIVSADNKGGGRIVALRRSDGELIWERARPKLPNYASPIILRTSGKDQLIFIGCKLVTSLDPLSGEQNWEISGATEECVTSTVTDGVHIYSSGGWPENHVAAVKADGSGSVVWQNRSRVYVPSMLIKDGYLYAVLDAGIAICWKADTGEEMWKARLGGDFSSSPVLVGTTIYATNEVGETFLFEASPYQFKQIGRNKLGDSVFSTPAICGGRIYNRVAVLEGEKREEYLYCLGQP